MAKLSEKERDILIRVGLVLLLVQTTERVIQVSMTFALPLGGVITLEVLEREKGDQRKRTLGQFLTALRKRVDLDDHFDAVLDEFLEKRNTLVHRIETVWSLEDEQEFETARGFLDRLFELNQIVSKTFLALTRAWQIDAQLKIPVSDGLFREPDEFYKSLARSVFFKKE